MEVSKGEKITSVLDRYDPEMRKRYYSNVNLECDTCHKTLVATSLIDHGHADYFTEFIFTCPERKVLDCGEHLTQQSLGFGLSEPKWKEDVQKVC